MDGVGKMGGNGHFVLVVMVDFLYLISFDILRIRWATKLVSSKMINAGRPNTKCDIQIYKNNATNITNGIPRNGTNGRRSFVFVSCCVL